MQIPSLLQLSLKSPFHIMLPTMALNSVKQLLHDCLHKSSCRISRLLLLLLLNFFEFTS